MKIPRLNSLFIFAVCVLGAPGICSAQVRVDGYMKNNGTYVQPYVRSAPDHTTSNNYGSPGNYNPNTGRVTPQHSNPYGSLGGGYGNNKRNSLGGWNNDD